MLLKETQVKKITNAEEHQESGSNDSQSETFQSSTTPDVKKSNESKLISYEINFLIFICPLLRMGGFVKLGEHSSARFSDYLNSNHHNISMKNKQCFKEMSNRNANHVSGMALKCIFTVQCNEASK